MKIKNNDKILFYDLETSRSIVEGYGTKWDYKPIKFIRQQEFMCYAYKYLGKDKVTYKSRHQFKTYKEFVQSLADLLNDCNVAIAHNGIGFDNKMSNMFFLVNDVEPPSPFKSIDTLRVARSNFKFMSNSLNDLAHFLGLGEKSKITYADLEEEFMSDKCSSKVERLMSKYNKQDVVLLEKIYNKLLPYIRNHPNIGNIRGENGICPKCGSNDLIKRGFNDARIPKQRYKCNNCKGWCNESTKTNGGRIVNA